MAGQWKAQAIEREAATALDELLVARLANAVEERQLYEEIEQLPYDPRGRVTVICGRCGQPALSETTPTILAHYTQAHGKAPRQLVLGRFEERCEVTR